MNLVEYIDKNLKSLSRKKKKNMIRKVKNKLRSIQPKILEAKILQQPENHKVYVYKRLLKNSLIILQESLIIK